MVVHAAPLAVFCDAGLVVIPVALAALSVLRAPDGVEPLQLFVNKGGDGVFHRLASFACSFFDLKALNKGLEARAELAYAAEGIFLLDGAAGHTHLVSQHVRGEDLLIAPELAELHALVYHAVRAELVHKALHLGVPLVDFVPAHEARALVPVLIVAADRVEGGLALRYLYALAAGEAAEAVAVRHDHGAAHFDQLGELGVVYLAAAMTTRARKGKDGSGSRVFSSSSVSFR